jgi:azurin
MLATALVASALATHLACSKPDSEERSAATPAPEPTTAPRAESTASATAVRPGGPVELAIQSVGNTMMYDKSALTVPTAAVVHLVLKNNSTMAAVPHNWVLVKPGAEARVANGAMKYGEPAGYINLANPDMLEHTPLAKAGETAEVTFTAPAPGTYPYICTVPGHYMMMKGVLTVTP